MQPTSWAWPLVPLSGRCFGSYLQFQLWFLWLPPGPSRVPHKPILPRVCRCLRLALSPQPSPSNLKRWQITRAVECFNPTPPPHTIIRVLKTHLLLHIFDLRCIKKQQPPVVRAQLRLLTWGFQLRNPLMAGKQLMTAAAVYPWGRRLSRSLPPVISIITIPQLCLSRCPTALPLTEPNAPACSPALRNPRARATRLHSHIWRARWLLTNTHQSNYEQTLTQHHSLLSSFNHNTCRDCEGLSTCFCRLTSPPHHRLDHLISSQTSKDQMIKSKACMTTRDQMSEKNKHTTAVTLPFIHR